MRRGRPPDPHPNARELDILASLWSLELAPVAKIREDLEDRFEYEFAYTTIHTLLRRMVAKGFVARMQEGTTVLFGARLSRRQVQAEALRRLQMSLFDGSTRKMIAMLEEQSLRRILETREQDAAEADSSLQGLTND